MQRMVSKLVASKRYTAQRTIFNYTGDCLERVRGNLTTCGNSYCTPKIFIEISANLPQQHLPVIS